MKRLALALAILPVGAACSSQGGRPPPPVDAARAPDPVSAAPVSGFPCSIEAVLRARCQTCHASVPRKGAPVPLVTWEQTRAQSSSGETVAATMRRYVATGYMPYTSTMPQAERDLLVAWLDRGIPRASDVCPP